MRLSSREAWDCIFREVVNTIYVFGPLEADEIIHIVVEQTEWKKQQVVTAITQMLLKGVLNQNPVDKRLHRTKKAQKYIGTG